MAKSGKDTASELGVRHMWSILDTLMRKVEPEQVDIGQRGWLKDKLTTLLESLKSLAETDPFCGEILDEMVAVIVNYGSISDPGRLGGRHTVVLLNLDKFKRGKLKTAEVAHIGGGAEEQNRVLTFQGGTNRSRPGAATRRSLGSRVKPLAPRVAERGWLNNWANYLRIEEKEGVYTLNNMLLGQAAEPQPTLIAFFDAIDRARDEEISTFMPASLSLASGEDLGNGPDISRFTERFRGMFGPAENGRFRGRSGQNWQIDETAVTAMVSRLHKHFGGIGGKVFASFPTSYRIGRDGSEDLGVSDMRAVVSVVSSREWDRAFYERAWLLFGGIASRILYRLLASEFESIARRRWQREQADAVYLVGHSLKHRVVPINDGIAQLDNALADLDAAPREPIAPTIRDALATASVKLRSNVAIMRGIVNLISVLKDANHQTESRIAKHLEEHSPTVTVDLIAQLHEAARWTFDASGARTVRLAGALGRSCRVASRFQIPELAHHGGEEKFLYATLFSELLQNAATYGKRKKFDAPIPVLVELNHKQITLSNEIDLESVETAQLFAERHDNRHQKRQSSGIYFAETIGSSFYLMDIEFAVFRNEGQLSFFDKNAWIWRTTMLIKGETT